jgi:hypothetical protein
VFRKLRLVYEDETYALLMASLLGVQWVPFVRVSVVLRQTGKVINANAWEKFHFMKTIDILRLRGIPLDREVWESLAIEFCGALSARGCVRHSVYFGNTPEAIASSVS